MEKAFKTMQASGAANIVLGILVMVVGITSGVIMLVNGARLLKNKNEITF